MKKMSWAMSIIMGAFLISTAVNGEEKAEGKAEASSITGEVGCAHCKFGEVTKAESCAPSVQSGDKVYYLKASDKASDDLKNKIQACKKEMKGSWTLKGEVKKEGGKEWLVVDQAEQAKGEADGKKKGG